MYSMISTMSILFVAVIIILLGHTYGGCHDPYALIEGMEEPKVEEQQNPRVTSKEGFAGANTNYGQSSPYDLSINNSVDTSSWMAPNMVVTPGQPLNPAVKEFLARPKQQLPLPEGQLDFFANTRFAPEFCPNTYSNSQGCAAMTGEQYNYLIQRGGNNVPYSEY
jgi:hypothetical protein